MRLVGTDVAVLRAVVGTAQDYSMFVEKDFTPRAIYDAVAAYARGA
ncbi:MAG: hypothetical protein ACR2JY_13405 [Chloroflexota bacterium]